MAMLLACGLAAGVPVPVVGILGAGVVAPPVGLGVVAVWQTVGWAVARGRDDGLREAAWLSAVAGELQGGASLRTALAEATVRVPLSGHDATVVRRLQSGAPIESVTDGLAAGLPTMGRLVAPAVRIGASTGGRSADMFGRLAVRSAEMADAARQRSSATAAVRLSAAVVGTIPVLLIGGLLVTGRLGAVVASGPVGSMAVVVGVGLQLAGLATVAVMSRRVLR